MKDKRFSFTMFVSGRLQTGQITKLSMYLCSRRSNVSLGNLPWKIALPSWYVAAVAISRVKNFSMCCGSRSNVSATSLKFPIVVRMPTIETNSLGNSKRSFFSVPSGTWSRARFNRSL